MESVMGMQIGADAERRRAKRFMEQVLYLDRRVEAMLERAERSRARLERVTAVYGPRGGGGSRADWTDIVAAVMEDDRRLNEEIDRLVDVKEEVRRAIREIGDGELMALMEMRYLNGMGWQQIALRMHIDKRTATRLHAKALGLVRVPDGFGE